MRIPQDWQQLLKIEPGLLSLETSVLSGRLNDYRQVPPKAFSWHGWDLIAGERLFRLILPFLRQQLSRGKNTMPEIYASRLESVDPGAINTPQEWWQVPILVKDDNPEIGLKGFRHLVNQRPDLLRPTDLNSASVAFGSGGSMGGATPTFVTSQDRAREIQGWRRGHDYHGLVPDDVVLYTYNTTHKGGQWMQESLMAHGVHICLRRPEEGPRQVLENIRRYGVNVLFTVQQPYQTMQHQSKAAGINLHRLVMASLEQPDYHGLLIPDRQGRKQVEFIFLGGFEIVPYALELTAEYLSNTPLATLLGSSEAIPQACSTHPGLTPQGLCHHNNLHLLQGPHYVEVVKAQEGAWIPVTKGEQGLLVYTSWARDGTIWLRYAPGDAATLLLEEGECPCGLYSPVISNVRRLNPDERDDLLIVGCAAG